MNFKQHLILIKDKRDIFKPNKTIAYQNIAYNNWWSEDPKTIWFTRAIREWFGDYERPVQFYSVFGPRKNIEKKTSAIKIFYTGENVEKRVRYKTLVEREEKAAGWEARMEAYRDYAINYMDLSIGFGFHEYENYLRIPFWILRYFDPMDTEQTIQEKLDAIEYNAGPNAMNSPRTGATVVSSHDFFGTRANIADSLKNVIDIEYGGKWRNNTNKLWDKYGNSKENYLKTFKFNICPENMDAEGYVTEKIFDAYSAGTIPIYHGSLENPEEYVLNKKSFISWHYDRDNDENIELIKNISSNSMTYLRYLSQPKFKPHAAEYIYENYIMLLHNRMKDILFG